MRPWLPIFFGMVMVMSALFATEGYSQITTQAGIVMSRASGKCLSVSNASTDNAAPVVQVECNRSAQSLWNLEAYNDAFRVVVSHTGDCLNVYGNLPDSGTQIIQWPCQGFDNELWYLDSVPAGYRFRAKNSNLCLTLSGDQHADGSPFVQADCTTDDRQVFSFGGFFVPPTQGVRLVNPTSQQCVDVNGNSQDAAAPLIQYWCPLTVASGGANQTWFFTRQDVGYKISVQSTGMCMDVYGASQDDGAQVIQYPCSGADNQTWFLQRQANGFQLVAKHSGKCLDAVNGNALTNLVQNTCANVPTQFWSASTAGYLGSWGPLVNLPLVPVGAAALPNGKFMLWSSWDPTMFTDNTGIAQTDTVLYDPATNKSTFATVSSTGHDMFCPGTALLSDGRLLINGGNSASQTSLYNYSTNTWASGAAMNLGRGYESDTVLDDGRVFTIGGSWSGGQGGKVGEIWSTTNTWTLLNGIPEETLYSDDPQGVFRWDNHTWMYGVGSGRVFQAGPSAQMNWFSVAGGGSYTAAGNRADDQYSMNGNAVMYDVGKILKLGGAPAYQNANATTASYTIDINAGVNVKPTGPLAYARSFVNSVVLPDGRVFVAGGQSYASPFVDEQAVLQGELWSPAANAFTTVAAMDVPRTYHSFALLMPDSRVMVGGGGLCGTCGQNHLNMQMYSPSYLFQANGQPAPRPAITTAPKTAGYAKTISVVTDSAVTQFTLIRLGSSTHSVDNDQRRVPLTISAQNLSTFTYTVKTPANSGIATPGYYMLFATNSLGVPSVAKLIQVK